MPRNRRFSCCRRAFLVVCGGVQFIRLFLRLADVLVKLRVDPFCGAKYQMRICPVQGFACLCHHASGSFQYLFRCVACIEGRIVLFGLPAGHVAVLAGGMVIQPVAGHTLRYLVTGF